MNRTSDNRSMVWISVSRLGARPTYFSAMQYRLLWLRRNICLPTMAGEASMRFGELVGGENFQLVGVLDHDGGAGAAGEIDAAGGGDGRGIDVVARSSIRWAL